MTQRRIAIAGFQHETNTFSPHPARFEDFEIADSWPALLTGPGVITQTRGLNLPIAGAVSFAEIDGDIDLLPILWCAAEPSGPVTDAAFDRISDMILTGLADAGQLDGLYLDLHGAMVTQSHHDGEAALLSRIRADWGADLPIAVSLDLHANISAAFVDLVDVVTIYRTYPHLDMAATGFRAMNALRTHIDNGPGHKAVVQAPFLVSLPAQFTGAAPCKGLYQRAESLSLGDREHVELAMGFTAADVPDCGPSVLAYAPTQARAEALAHSLMSEICAAEAMFDDTLYEPHEAVRLAMRTPGTIVLADVQDNAGAGGSSDTTGLLKALIDEGAQHALFGVLCDADLAAQAHAQGIGSCFQTLMGGRESLPDQTPLRTQCRVLALSDGRIDYSGEMYGGGTAEIGPSCLLGIGQGAIQVVVSSQRTQCLDRAFFTHFGADPARAKIVCVKSTVHFHADFDPIASQTLNVAVPGLFPCNLEDVHYKHVQKRVAGGANTSSPRSKALSKEQR